MGELSRKAFIRQSLLASAALPLLALASGKQPRLSVPANSDAGGLEKDEKFWKKVREQFVLDREIINFNNGSVGPQNKAVQESHIDMYRLSNQSPAYYMWKKVNKKREQLREELALLMQCQTEEVAINRNTTEGLNTVIFGLNLNAGDEVVISDFDYPFMLNAWRQREMRDGVVIKQVKLPLPIEDVDLAVDLYQKAITPKTKVVHLTHVLNWTGQVMPVREITAMAQQNGCEVVVDAAHSLAHVPLSFQEIGCDYMATSLHKWLGAPFGTGALIVKNEKKTDLWPLMSPYEPKSEDIRKFEFLGTRSIPAEMAALDAIAFHLDLGVDNVHKRLHYLKNYWVERVRNVEGIQVHTSLKPEFGGAIATFSVHGLKAGEIMSRLFKEEKIHTGMIVWNGLDAVRISPHIYCTLDELDRLVSAIKRLANG